MGFSVFGGLGSVFGSLFWSGAAGGLQGKSPFGHLFSTLIMDHGQAYWFGLGWSYSGGEFRPTFTFEPYRPTAFTAYNGHILAPGGHDWRGKGIAVYDADAKWFGADLAAKVTASFPGLNLIRLAANTGDTPASLAPFVNAATALGVAVVIEDHSVNFNVLTGKALAAETAWYAGMAKYFNANPYVMYQTMNEPAKGDIGQISATYDALRKTGYQGLIFLEAGEGAAGIADTLGTGYRSAIARMHNVAWDLHSYNWQCGFSADLAAIRADQDSRIAVYKSILSGSGLMPVVSLETGEATNGLQIDAGGYQRIAATFGNPNLTGAAAWAWDNWGTPGLVNSLTNPGGDSLTAYGQEIAGLIKASP